ncbi:hypothetical protein OKW21_001616 [Catalinimonas alkaloidigena]|uniref:FG-GAP repeat domain-containing protein n=1 Tax=Catalinimonas alkaloidigena TaxID=1075417 RepID=UPI00240683A5|nr:VCBS repeat-containing protein [Catalinimonas alkaloidigena]MDF9796353.1 hypothetical protein [Catalinimonas alkaloidigena]
MFTHQSKLLTLLITAPIFGACHYLHEPGFRQIPLSEHSIQFINQLRPTASINIFNFNYFYSDSDGGVGIGDFNGNSLPDIYMGGNMVSSGLYLNLGSFRSEDITLHSRTGTDRWLTRISVVDINHDHLTDLYLGVSGLEQAKRGNLQFVNQGNNARSILQFKKMSVDYGLDYDGYTTYAAFSDFDQDQDLDIYLLNAVNTEFYGNQIRKIGTDEKALTSNKLFENRGIGENGHPVFKDISVNAGITKEGIGLGINYHDFNEDSFSDINVSYDCLSNDLLNINIVQQDGTFCDEEGHGEEWLNLTEMVDSTKVTYTNNYVLEEIPDYTNVEEKQFFLDPRILDEIGFHKIP